MSDYDDDDEPLRKDHEADYDPTRVRRGSEGFEIRPVQPWLEESHEMEDMGNEQDEGYVGSEDDHRSGIES